MKTQDDNLQVNMDEFLPLRDVVFKTLRRGILTGELKPGERLMEIHLANRLGVSRTPIREAIRKLELEGLVTMVPRRGAEVANITEKNLKDVLEVRQALESLAIELACDRITDENKEGLKEKLDQVEHAVQTEDTGAIASADVAFHDAIVEASGNTRLVQLVSNLGEQMYRYRFEYIKDVSKHSQIMSEHRTMYESIMEKDKEKAAQIVKTHIGNQEEAIMRKIQRDKTAAGLPE